MVESGLQAKIDRFEIGHFRVESFDPGTFLTLSRLGIFIGDIFLNRNENIAKHDTMVVDLECDGHRVHSKRRCFRRLKQVMDYYKEIIQH